MPFCPLRPWMWDVSLALYSHSADFTQSYSDTPDQPQTPNKARERNFNPRCCDWIIVESPGQDVLLFNTHHRRIASVSPWRSLPIGSFWKKRSERDFRHIWWQRWDHRDRDYLKTDHTILLREDITNHSRRNIGVGWSWIWQVGLLTISKGLLCDFYYVGEPSRETHRTPAGNIRDTTRHTCHCSGSPILIPDKIRHQIVTIADLYTKVGGLATTEPCHCKAGAESVLEAEKPSLT